ncbi:MAG: glycerophosphodiester phosphodiesterase family protein, partial [Armatimonadetes bacterium]|nr:glycerophosphodiester phosphodiesterase family protein [Armatimonadota bacterium]
TLAALDLGIEVGVDGVEIDVRRTADDHYVLMHDDTVDRTTNGQGQVAELTLEQVRALEIRWTPMQFIRKTQFPVPPDAERFQHLKVPTLGEALDRARGRAFVMLDLKAEDVEGVTRVVGERGMLSEVIFKVNSVEEGEAVAAAAPQAILMGRPDDEAELDAMLAALHPPIVHLDDATFTPPIIERLDDAGALIWMNTLGKTDAVALVADGDDLRWAERLGNDLARLLGVLSTPHVRAYRKLAERGADFIQTDNLVAVVEAMRDFPKPTDGR